MNKDKNTTKNIILYLLDSLGSRIEGKKKIMKLMFLLEHYDLSKEKLTPKQFLGNDYYIYFYGVFSKNIMHIISELIEKDKVKDGFPLKSNLHKKVMLDKDLQERVDSIVKEFGKYSGYKLEVKTLEMLGIEPHTKSQYFGKSISEIIKQHNAPN